MKKRFRKRKLGIQRDNFFNLTSKQGIATSNCIEIQWNIQQITKKLKGLLRLFLPKELIYPFRLSRILLTETRRDTGKY